MKMFRGLPLKMAPDHGDDHDDDNELMLMIVVMVVLKVRNSMSGTNYLTVPPDGSDVHTVCTYSTTFPLDGSDESSTVPTDGSDDLLNRSPLMGRTTY